MTTARNHLRQLAIDAIDDYAAFLTAEQEALEGRIANLRACLASIEARAADCAAFTGELQRFEKIKFSDLAAAARGALEADDREAERR